MAWPYVGLRMEGDAYATADAATIVEMLRDPVRWVKSITVPHELEHWIECGFEVYGPDGKRLSVTVCAACYLAATYGRKPLTEQEHRKGCAQAGEWRSSTHAGAAEPAADRVRRWRAGGGRRVPELGQG